MIKDKTMNPESDVATTLAKEVEMLKEENTKLFHDYRVLEETVKGMNVDLNYLQKQQYSLLDATIALLKHCNNIEPLTEESIYTINELEAL